MSAKPLPALPGPAADAARRAAMLRVDHAGELGAVHIYRGQRAVMAAGGRSGMAETLAEMQAHEAAHLARLDTLLNENRVRPTLLAPMWRFAGFALGAATALIGESAAHACTEAVEEVIEAHYGGQIAELESREPALAGELAAFREDEAAHRQAAIAAGARAAPAHGLLTAVIRAGCRAAIKISERL